MVLSSLVPSKREKIYKLRQLSLSQFVYFLSTEPSLFTFTKESIFKTKTIFCTLFRCRHPIQMLKPLKASEMFTFDEKNDYTQTKRF